MSDVQVIKYWSNTLIKMLKNTIAASLLMAVSTLANAALITSDTISSPVVVDFSTQVTVTNTATPIQIGGLIGADIVASNAGLGGGLTTNFDGWGLVDNGSWGTPQTYISSQSETVLRFSFNDGPVAAVGGFMNHAPGTAHLIITALDAGLNVLETYDITILADIVTPDGYNEGAFRGIVRPSADISFFDVTGRSPVLDDLTFSGVTATTYTVGGDVSGLTSAGLELQLNNTGDLVIAADGPFVFIPELLDTAPYVVTVSNQPTGQTCSVTNDSGNIAATDVTNVTVTCVDDVVPTYSVGGAVSGLMGTGLALQNNGVDTLAITADGPFTFLTELVTNAAYAVTVSTQPIGQTCSVTNDSGTIATANVADVDVACVDDVAPPIPVTPIPTLSQWALIMLSMLLGLMVFSNRKHLF